MSDSLAAAHAFAPSRAAIASRRRVARALRRSGLCASFCWLIAACGNDTTWLDTSGADALAVSQSALSSASALRASDILGVPAPILRERGGIGEVTLPGGAIPAALRLLATDRSTLIQLSGDPRGNRVLDTPALAAPSALLVQVEAGSEPLALAETDLFLTDQARATHEIYLPALTLAAGARAELWVAQDGSTYTAPLDATTPDFSTLRRPRVAWWSAPDMNVTRVAAGLEQPVSIAVVPAPGVGGSAPMLYVAERTGRIRVLRRDGVLATYVDGLLNFDPLELPATSERGVSGVAVDPTNGDLYVTLTYDDDPSLESAPYFSAVERFTSSDGGLTADTRTRIKSLAPETESESRGISRIGFGPDDLLYVHVGDSGQPSLAQDLERFHGKILRLTRDGSPSPRNPYYNAENGISPRDFVYVSGLREPLGAAYRNADDAYYFVESGPEQDRFARALVGKNYGWNGSNQTLAEGALYNWSPGVRPTSIAFVQSEWLGGSGFSSDYRGRAYITQSAGTGPGDASHKAITEWQVRADGNLQDGSRAVAFYRGAGDATPVALAAGVDGLYFTDLLGEDADDPDGEGASLLRLEPAMAAPALDCNQNAVPDTTDLELGTSLDCNAQGVPDECDIAAGRSADCDMNGVPDECAVTAARAHDFATEDSGFVLNGAEISDGALRLLPEIDATASALHPPTGRLPTKQFQVDFEFRIAGTGSDGVLFAAFDADRYPDTQTFGVEGLAEGSLEVIVDTLGDAGEAENSVVVRFDGETLGRYVPSFELDDDQLHGLRVAFDGRYLSVSLAPGLSGRETAFQALEVPDYVPFVARFGFGANGRAGARPVVIDDVVFQLPTAADVNENRVPDACECLADFDDGSETGTADGAVTEADLRYFLTLFRSGSIGADVDDGSETGTPDGVVGIEDLRYFRARYGAGC